MQSELMKGKLRSFNGMCGCIIGDDHKSYSFNINDISFVPDYIGIFPEGTERIVSFEIYINKKGRLSAIDIKAIDGKLVTPNLRKLQKTLEKAAPYMIKANILEKHINPTTGLGDFITIEGHYRGSAKSHKNHVHIDDFYIVDEEESRYMDHTLLLNHMRDYSDFWNEFQIGTVLILSGNVYSYDDDGQRKYSLDVNANTNDVRRKYR